MLTYPDYYAAIERILAAANSADLTNVTFPNTTGMTRQNATYFLIGHYIRKVADMQNTPVRNQRILDAVCLLIHMKRQLDDPLFDNVYYSPTDIEPDILTTWQRTFNDMAHMNTTTLLGLISFSCNDEMQDVAVWCQTQLTLLASFSLTHGINLEALIQSL